MTLWIVFIYTDFIDIIACYHYLVAAGGVTSIAPAAENPTVFVGYGSGSVAGDPQGSSASASA